MTSSFPCSRLVGLFALLTGGCSAATGQVSDAGTDGERDAMASHAASCTVRSDAVGNPYERV